VHNDMRNFQVVSVVHWNANPEAVVIFCLW